ncbi:MAG: hypothetical protein AAF543_09515 [Pseudomonadota bacterium]
MTTMHKAAEHDTAADPHVALQEERERLRREFADLFDDDVHFTDKDLDRRNGEFLASELPLIEKIQRTPAITIEGALCQIEAIDQHEDDMGVSEEHEVQAMVRAEAIATIRRCIGVVSESEPLPERQVSSSLAELLKRYRQLEEQYENTPDCPLGEHNRITSGLMAQMNDLALQIANVPVVSRADVVAKLNLTFEGHGNFAREMGHDDPIYGPATIALKEAIAWLER